MAEDLDKLLQSSEKFMEQARKDYNIDTSLTANGLILKKTKAIYLGIEAIYSQNKAIIELLKRKQ